jgi:hypothetical protein
MKSLYPKRTDEELKKIINDTSEEVFKGFIDEPEYFCGCDPTSGKDFVVVYKRHPDGTIEVIKK